MTFNDVLSQTIAMLRQHGRVSYRALKRQFAVDEAVLEDLKHELIEVQQRAVDHDGTVLVWTGDASAAATPAPSPSMDVPPFGTRPEPKLLAYTPPHLAEKIRTSRAALEGERKQVTVLFADLKGSMELLADRDPEDARQLLDPVLERMMAAVHRYEGTVNQVMGDGIMALFGAPIAHEDHAVRACYAALAMQTAIKQYAAEVQRTKGVPIQMRVGLNSGEVVVRSIGNDLHMDYSAIGQTTHLAARMEQIAMPGSILITAEVLRLAEGYVQVAPLGPVPVKGLPEPADVYEVTGAGPARTRLQASAARGLTRFVGRDTELDTLRQALDRAGSGHGQVMAVIGEPGVGKSRLFWEFTQSHRTHGWLILESRSASYGKATAYLPVLDLLKGYFRIDPQDDVRRLRQKVAGKLLTLDRALEPTLPALLALLEVPVEDAQWQAFDPPQRRRRTLEAIKHLLLRESQVQPLCLVFEDLHWIDAETQALLDSLVESLPTARMLLLVNYRPEYRHGWGSKTYYTQLRREWSTVQERAEASLVLSTEQAFVHWVGPGTFWRGCALVAQGQGEEGMAQMQQGLAARQATGNMLSRAAYLALLAEADGRIGQAEAGLRLLAEALVVMDQTGTRSDEPELYRIKGELLQRQAVPDTSQAEVCFQQALAVARRQQAKSWELRAAVSLGRLWQAHGKCAAARELLAPVYDWFTEGFDTADLQEAKALLETLA